MAESTVFNQKGKQEGEGPIGEVENGSLQCPGCKSWRHKMGWEGLAGSRYGRIMWAMLGSFDFSQV